MRPFTKSELKGVLLILFALLVATLSNLRISIRKARDAQRRADLASITNALNKYQEEFGFYPHSEDGKIKACEAENFEEVIQMLSQKKERSYQDFFAAMRPCQWGEDELKDIFSKTSSVYLSPIPQDPKQTQGIEYLYISNTRMFQLYAHLEGGKPEIGYDEKILSRNLNCGDKICNFGKSSGVTPLDKSLEEYERLLIEKNNSGI